MKRHPQTPIFTILALVLIAACSTGLFSKNNSAKQNSVQALVTTTRSVKLLVTTAALLADTGVITEPQWNKIAAESVQAGNALQKWSDAIKANQSTTEYEMIVAQALAIIDALLPAPSSKHALMDPAPFVLDDVPASLARLARPDVYRHQFAGGM